MHIPPSEFSPSLIAGPAVRAAVCGGTVKGAIHSGCHLLEIGFAEIPEGLGGKHQLLALALDHGSLLGSKVIQLSAAS
jgi:hypothetical protein